MALGTLMLLPRWAQVFLVGAGFVGAGGVIGHAVFFLDGQVLLGGLMLLAGVWGLDFILRALWRDAGSPSVAAPGGADAPGGHGKRDGERDAPILPSGPDPTAGRAGRPRSFSEGMR